MLWARFVRVGVEVVSKYSTGSFFRYSFHKINPDRESQSRAVDSLAKRFLLVIAGPDARCELGSKAHEPGVRGIISGSRFAPQGTLQF